MRFWSLNFKQNKYKMYFNRVDFTRCYKFVYETRLPLFLFWNFTVIFTLFQTSFVGTSLDLCYLLQYVVCNNTYLEFWQCIHWSVQEISSTLSNKIKWANTFILWTVIYSDVNDFWLCTWTITSIMQKFWCASVYWTYKYSRLLVSSIN